MRPATRDEVIEAFASQPQFQCLSGSTIAELLHRDLLQVTTNGRWRYGDARNGCRRSFKNPKWKRADTKGDDWHKLTGLQDVVEHERPQVVFVIEGSKDALAAAEMLNRLGLLKAGIVAALGAGYRPIASEIAELRGRKVVLIGDADAAGRICVRLVSHALTEQEVDHVVFCWQESSCKDVFDLVKLHVDQKSDFGPVFASLRDFFSTPPLPSNRSTAQQFNSSTSSTTQHFNSSTTQQFNPSTQEGSSVEQENFNPSTQENAALSEFVTPYVATKPGTGNTWSFNLARAVRLEQERSGVMLTEAQLERIFDEWFNLSRPMLPADADRDKSLRVFYGQLSRVRYLPTSLHAALERARSSPVPALPNLNETALRVAALYRELQRDAGVGCAFICPVNVIVEYAALGWPQKAKWIQTVLERNGVIHCVERGAPHLEGKRGKSALWRYLQPL
jgi:hypothetical protein